MQAVLMVRSELTADASLAEIRARSKFGMAIAAMIRIIATTIKSSMREKPFSELRIIFSPVSSQEPCGGSLWHTVMQRGFQTARGCLPNGDRGHKTRVFNDLRLIRRVSGGPSRRV